MKTIKILVVDDNKDLVVTIKKYFENTNIQIKYEANDIEEGFKLIESKKEDYDLILIDPLLPKIDSLTILERIKERTNKNVFIISSYKDNELLENARELNINNQKKN